jgi:NAD(P)H dehydrogenase (quinone)
LSTPPTDRRQSESSPVEIAIVYWTGSGHTARLAEHVAAGAGDGACLVDVSQMTDADWQRLDRSAAIVFGTLTFMGVVSGGFKAFMDESSDRWGGQAWADKIAAGFTVATFPSGDKMVSLTQLAVFAAQHGMVWVGQNQIGAPVNPEQPGINEAGFWLGLAATSSRNKTLLIEPADAETARLFGARIAMATHRWLQDGQVG